MKNLKEAFIMESFEKENGGLWWQARKILDSLQLLSGLIFLKEKTDSR